MNIENKIKCMYREAKIKLMIIFHYWKKKMPTCFVKIKIKWTLWRLMMDGLQKDYQRYYRFNIKVMKQYLSNLIQINNGQNIYVSNNNPFCGTQI